MNIAWITDNSGLKQTKLMLKHFPDSELILLPPLEFPHPKPFIKDKDGRFIPVNIQKTVESLDPDVIIVHGWLNSNLLEKLSKKYVLICRGSYNFLQMLLSGGGTKATPILDMADYIYKFDGHAPPLSSDVAQLTSLNLDSELVKAVPYAYDDTQKVRLSTCTDPSILLLSHLDKEVNGMVLLQALKLLKRNIPNAELGIYGDGEMKGTYWYLASEMDLASVKFVSPSVDLNTVFSQVSVMALPSIASGFPPHLLEAYQRKVPCILPKAMWSSGFPSPQCRHDDPREWAGELKKLLASKVDRESVALSQMAVLDRFSPKVVGKELREFVEKVYDKKKKFKVG